MILRWSALALFAAQCAVGDGAMRRAVHRIVAATMASPAVNVATMPARRHGPHGGKSRAY
jgi:hypothetical protein